MADTNPDLDEVELGNGDIDYSTEEGRARLDRRQDLLPAQNKAPNGKVRGRTPQQNSSRRRRL